MTLNSRRAWLQVTWIAVGLLWSSSADGLAFTARTRSTIVHKSVSLMPPALARQLRKHARVLHQAALSDLTQSGPVRETKDPALAGQQLERSVRQTIGLINDRAPMREVARALGEIASQVADLSFALSNQTRDPRAQQVYEEFASYVEHKLPKIAVTFAGYTEPHLAQADVTGFAAEIVKNASRDYDGVLRSYFPEGRARHPADFDERSVAFAVASLETSLAVTSTARIWLYVWHYAGGDLEGTPFLSARDISKPFQPTAAATGEGN
jgi:hypothetical protein